MVTEFDEKWMPKGSCWGSTAWDLRGPPIGFRGPRLVERLIKITYEIEYKCIEHKANYNFESNTTVAAAAAAATPQLTRPAASLMIVSCLMLFFYIWI